MIRRLTKSLIILLLIVGYGAETFINNYNEDSNFIVNQQKNSLYRVSLNHNLAGFNKKLDDKSLESGICKVLRYFENRTKGINKIIIKVFLFLNGCKTDDKPAKPNDDDKPDEPKTSYCKEYLLNLI